MIWRSELIGKQADFINKQTGEINSGIIVDETMNTFEINTKIIIKKENKININGQMIDGAKLNMRSMDRVKARFKKEKEKRI